MIEQLFHNNFSLEDYVVTFTFAKIVDKAKAQKEFSNYIKRLRRLYKRFGSELKYLYVYEGRSNGKRPHFHVVLNRSSGLNRDDIEKLWKLGVTRARMLRPDDSSGICASLCEYFAKEIKQTSKHERSWGCSESLNRSGNVVDYILPRVTMKGDS